MKWKAFIAFIFHIDCYKFQSFSISHVEKALLLEVVRTNTSYSQQVQIV